MEDQDDIQFKGKVNKQTLAMDILSKPITFLVYIKNKLKTFPPSIYCF